MTFKIKPTKTLLIAFVILLSINCLAQQFEHFFPAKDLTTVGVYYYPEHWHPDQWERDLKNIAEMGYEFTHFGEFAWAQLEPEEGRYDFKWLDTALELAAKYKLKVIMCTSTATPPVWLVRKHPDILATDEDGSKMDHGSRQHASFSNNYYRSYSMKMIAELAKKYGNDKRVIGWQIDNEPRRFLDYGNDALQRYREWLKDKYKTIDVLNEAWGNNFWSGTYSSFDEINLPLHRQWGMNLHSQLDHYRFADHETASFLDEQALEIRKYASKNQWITSNYIPMYHVGYVGMSKALDFDCYTRYMVYGSDLGIGSQGYRVGEYSRISMSNDFFRPLKGMYGVMELQPGQVNWGSINPQPLPGAMRMWLWHVFAGGSKFTCTYRYRAPLYGYEQYHYGIVGPDGVTQTTGGKEFSQFMSEINTLRKKYDAKATLPESYIKRKTGILFNADNVMGINLNKQTTEWNTEAHFLKYYKAVKSFGAPVDFVRDSTNFSNYPVLIAPAYQMIDQQMIDKLTNYAKNGGHLVLSCRSGIQNRKGHLWEAKFYEPMWQLIGAEIESYDLLMPHAPGKITFNNQEFEWVSWGDLLKPNKETETWARFQNNFYAGTPAVVSRKLGKGTVTYIGVDSKNGGLEKQVLTQLYQQQHIPIENYPEGIMVEYRDGFGIAVNYSDKVYTMELPANATILIGTKAMKTADVLVWKY
ncbi:Beta-galactosidase BgaA [Mariniflexile rhizosphaerae]|uniref:beta-galactosidase n=1 Tax=unclassified Mariniflexile TaxID=2643887 RepID=UPI000CAC2671|nr:beta-galactosidase [Mariniflexile sp. TRM1-10]AXP81757.1 Beta-galactosidase BgaA [Mariniflexile sp. TRM1-10]PLB20861.1 MAG: Beta-galactosidase [Flavobacteriaceae bacterium FS1-H7996/R]